MVALFQPAINFIFLAESKTCNNQFIILPTRLYVNFDRILKLICCLTSSLLLCELNLVLLSLAPCRR